MLREKRKYGLSRPCGFLPEVVDASRCSGGLSGCLCRHGGGTGTAGSRDGGVHGLDCCISISGSRINIRSVKVRDLHAFYCGFIKKTTNIHFVHLAYLCRKREENEKSVHSRDTLRFASCESRIFFFFFFTLITNNLALTYSLK